MKNQVIEVLNEEHGQRVKKYWEDRGVDLNGWYFINTAKLEDSCRYYGTINDVFFAYSIHEVNDGKAEIITLPEEPQFKRGDRVLVRSEHKRTWVNRIFVAEIKGSKYKYAVVYKSQEGFFEKGEEFVCSFYQEIKPLPEKKEITLSELFQKAGINPDEVKVVDGGKV